MQVARALQVALGSRTLQVALGPPALHLGRVDLAALGDLGSRMPQPPRVLPVVLGGLSLPADPEVPGGLVSPVRRMALYT